MTESEARDLIKSSIGSQNNNQDNQSKLQDTIAKAFNNLSNNIKNEFKRVQDHLSTIDTRIDKLESRTKERYDEIARQIKLIKDDMSYLQREINSIKK